MQTNLSIWGLILQASFFVQMIMLVLFLMFLITLFVTGKKCFQYQRLNYKVRRFQKKFWSDTDLNHLFEEYKKQECESIESIFVYGFHEFFQCHKNSLDDTVLVVENCRRAMQAALTAESTRQERGLAMLSSFSSSAPYIGLLGTVYGIMSAFIALGGTHQASISSVAPGIAEALIATAIGLLAAIPSVLSYNFFTAKSDDLIAKYEGFIEEFCNLLQRRMMVLNQQKRR